MTDNNLTLPPTVIERAIENDPRLHSPHTKRQYNANLTAFEAWRDGRPMTKTLVESYAAYLQGLDLAPASINQKLASVRWWARKMIDLAYDNLPEEQAEKVSKQAARILTVGDVRGERLQRGRHLKGSELVHLIRACLADPSPAGLRDAALFAAAWTTGLRRAEFASLRLEDIIPMEETGKDGEIVAYAELRVHGKGDKVRLAYLLNGAYAAVQDWLKLRGDAPGYLFCPVLKSGLIATNAGPISGEALRQIAEKRIDEANLKTHLTWHDFRRTFAGNLLDKNDLATVQALLGHASPTTTSMYDRRGEERRRQAVHGLSMPKV